jgi:hypothetical protein
MYCNNCGSEMPNGAKFCSNCGTPMAAPVEPAIEPTPEPLQKEIELTAVEEAPRKAIFDEFQWNVSEYPERNLVEKTEDIDLEEQGSVEEELPENDKEPEITNASLENFTLFGNSTLGYMLHKLR